MNFVMMTLCGLLVSSFSFAASDDHVRSEAAPAVILRPHASGMAQGTFSQVIDHAGQLPGQTFQQRYWVDSEFASSAANAPVLYHICGEGDVDDSYFLTDNVMAWAKALGAHVVFLEHRYYGQSLPFADLSDDHLQYLNLNNVLEDLASFQQWLASQNNWQGKWISVGGSYSGTLSALYRQAHPELVVGALASSAPMISGVGSYDNGPSNLNHLASTDPSVDSGGRQWIYQACTTFGFWEADGEEFGAGLESPSASLCQRLFGQAPYFNAANYNQSYDLPFIQNGGAPSNILFTYGGDDVWTQLGVSQQNSQNANITVQVIPGAGHHFDLNAATSSDSAAVKKARAQFIALAKKWLGTNP